MNRIGDISVEVGVTGFVVYENAGSGMMGRKWAFETPASLAKFVTEWAKDSSKKIDK
jgi:hypothetical protein